VEWLLAAVAALIIGVLVVGALRSERTSRLAQQRGRSGDGGVAIGAGVIASGSAADDDAGAGSGGGEGGDGGGAGGADGGGGGSS
jgi:hypothetical protein